MHRLLIGVALIASTAATLAQGSRSLATFDRAWTIIRDTHFDPAMNGVDWEGVRKELRPRAERAASDGELRVVIRDMLGRLGQSHFALIPSTADSPDEAAGDLTARPGFDVRLVGDELVVTSVDEGGAGAAAGVRPGWILTSIGSSPTKGLLGTVPADLPRRLFVLEVWRLVETKMRGPSGSRVQLGFLDGESRPVSLTIERRREPGQPAKVGNLPAMFVRVESEAHRTPGGATAAVIAFNVWMPSVDSLFQKAIDQYRSADGIVIDLRGNPGGMAAMLMGISGHFLTERKPLGIMKTRDNELRFPANPRLVSASGEPVAPYAGPLAILVDGLTGSASECFAGGMQALGRARVFGQTSMGQALPAMFDRLPNGDILIHAYGDFVTADGTRLEGRGVVPDEEVPLSRAELLAGRDATLERALQWIDREARGKSPAL
jgi:carboxyl-terminal processing protease